MATDKERRLTYRHVEELQDSLIKRFRQLADEKRRERDCWFAEHPDHALTAAWKLLNSLIEEPDDASYDVTSLIEDADAYDRAATLFDAVGFSVLKDDCGLDIVPELYDEETGQLADDRWLLQEWLRNARLAAKQGRHLVNPTQDRRAFAALHRLATTTAFHNPWCDDHEAVRQRKKPK